MDTRLLVLAIRCGGSPQIARLRRGKIGVYGGHCDHRMDTLANDTHNLTVIESSVRSLGSPCHKIDCTAVINPLHWEFYFNFVTSSSQRF